MSDKLVSARILRERIAELQANIEAQRKVRADNDPFFKHAAWLLAEWEQALRDAEREYVTTAEAVRLTGWSAQTLRERGRECREGKIPQRGWEGLLARLDGNEWSFCVATIPVKGRLAA